MEQLERFETKSPQKNVSMLLPKKTVFIVEDDVSIREFLATYLEDNGYWVKSARNGKEAINKLKGTTSPSVFLVDAMMPEMNGYELIHWLRSGSNLSQVPILMMSAFKKLDGIKEWDEFIPKPFDLNDLEARIKRYCYSPTTQKVEKKTPLKLAASDTHGFLTEIEENPEVLFVVELFLLAAVALIARGTKDFVP